MFWRLPRSEYHTGRGEANRAALRRLTESDPPPGVLAYVGNEIAGWCTVAPRQEFVRLKGSRILKPVDDQPVWSIPCFFVAREFRRRGISTALLVGATKLAQRHGARVVEGYPVDARGKRQPDVFVYTGLAPVFLSAGFVEVARRSPGRPVMRWVAKGRRGGGGGAGENRSR